MQSWQGMSSRRRFAVIACAMAVALACTARIEPVPLETRSAPDGGEPEAPWHEGILESGFVAIGGEHTGWMLHRTGADDVMIDVDRVAERARELDGRAVRVCGRIVERDYVERGRIPVLVAELIEPAP